MAKRYRRRDSRLLELCKASNEVFYASYEWRKLRMDVLVKYGPRCMCCGSTPRDGIRITVDHIRPRKIRPELALRFDNLQVLCNVCNHGKGNEDSTDWRPKTERTTFL